MKSIVLDTNCLIAPLPSRSPYHQVWSDFVEGKYILCVSNEILTEYEEILTQKTNPIFANNVIKTILNRWNIRKIDPTFNFRLIKSDPDDDKFVNCAICGNARFIVSEDAHFKHLKDIPFPYVEVLRLREFMNLIQFGG